MARILVVSGHPALSRSLANATVLKKLEESGLDLSILYLDKEGWEFDVEKAQKELKEAKAIVFQFPVFWYSYPSLLKKWVEDVFTHGFAYGSEGTALQGKEFFISCSTGSPEETYRAGGPQNHPIKEFFYNFDQIAALCGMQKHDPIVTYGCNFIPGISPDSVKDTIVKQAAENAEKLIADLKKI